MIHSTLVASLEVDLVRQRIRPVLDLDVPDQKSKRCMEWSPAAVCSVPAARSQAVETRTGSSSGPVDVASADA